MKNIYLSILSFYLSLIPLISFAQTNYEDAVYLKDGTIIHGIIIEQVPNQSIKIQTKDNNIFFFKIDEIEKLTKEQIHKAKKDEQDNKKIKKSRYFNISEMYFGHGRENNGMTGLSNSNSNYWGVHTINGYLVNSNFSVGIGAGIDYFISYNKKFGIPIFLDLRAYLLKNKITPFISAGIGYMIITYKSPDDGSSGGILINPAIGVKFPVTKKSALNFSIGYRRQETTISIRQTTTLDPGGIIVNYSNKANYFNFKLGFSF